MHAQLIEQARALKARTVDLRRRIHRHPELGLDLPRTREAVLEALAGLELDIALSETTSGIVATLHGARPGPTVLLRGDMDALPLVEETGLEFASAVAGRMHACGHDAHTAMLASAAHLLSEYRDEFAGAVCFMFQPGEEGPGGAEPMLAEGLLAAGGPPLAAFALHVAPELPPGVIGCRSGPILAGADTVAARILGRGGHGSMPHNALDPIPVACEVVQAIQTLVTRRFNVFDPVVATVGRIQAGTTSNVIPEIAELDITLRSLSPASRQRLTSGVERLVREIPAAHGLQVEFSLNTGYPPTVNHASGTAAMARAARDLFGENGYLELAAPWMGAEDFSLVLERYPGAFAFIGAAPSGDGPHAPCHSNHMMIDEQALPAGVAMYALLALQALAEA